MENESVCESERSERSVTSLVPRGGPIFFPNMVGNITTVTEFQSSFLNLLQDLESHLSMESSSSSQQLDVSIDTLKVYTEEELTEMAMKEAFKEDNELQESLTASSPKNIEGLSKVDDLDNSTMINKQFNCSVYRGAKRKRTEKKTVVKKRTEKKADVKKKTEKKTEEAYLAKVEQLAKLKQKQEEDKADVRLHCFSKTFDIGKGAAPPPEGLEQMSLKFVDPTRQLVKLSDVQGQVETLFPEVILCIEIYNSRKIKTQDILVLGCHMLTVLKDKIHCLTDQVMKKAGTYDPSGYFLIEDIFHNDLRNPSATDYSKPIRNWRWNSEDEARKKWEYILTGESQQKQKAILGRTEAMDLPQFGTKEMQSTRFCDIRFRLGANYLYCHQGDCKHMIVIRDMRLCHPDDVQSRAAYPIMFRPRHRIQKCSVCKIHRATKVAVDDKWANENPCYFCDVCFELLHSEDGPIPCDFPVYDYVYEER